MTSTFSLLPQQGRALSLVLLCMVGGLPSVAAADLFQSGSTFRSLTADKRAWRAGDVLTVQVVENSSASANANTTTEKNGGLRLGWKSTTSERDASLSMGDNFNGRGQIQRSGKLLAQITVTVQAVDPVSGLLQVAGEQQILVNDEKQEIRLEGRVRPVDILDNNTVLSTRLADARISYVGDGVLGEKQRPGILTRLLSWLGLL